MLFKGVRRLCKPCYRPPFAQGPRRHSCSNVIAASKSFRLAADALLPDVDEQKRSLLLELHESMIADKVESAKALAALEERLKLRDVLDQIRGEKFELQATLQQAKTDLAKERGLLSCHGMIELVEEEFRKAVLLNNMKTNGRVDLWKQCLELKKFQPLRDCLLNVTGLTSRSSEAIGKSVASFYTEMSTGVHGHSSTEEWISSKEVLDIDAAMLSKPRGRMIACIAKFLMVRYSFLDAPSSDEGDQGDHGDNGEYMNPNV